MDIEKDFKEDAERLVKCAEALAKIRQSRTMGQWIHSNYSTPAKFSKKSPNLLTPEEAKEILETFKERVDLKPVCDIIKERQQNTQCSMGGTLNLDCGNRNYSPYGE